MTEREIAKKYLRGLGKSDEEIEEILSEDAKDTLPDEDGNSEKGKTPVDIETMAKLFVDKYESTSPRKRRKMTVYACVEEYIIYKSHDIKEAETVAGELGEKLREKLPDAGLSVAAEKYMSRDYVNVKKWYGIRRQLDNVPAYRIRIDAAK